MMTPDETPDPEVTQFAESLAGYLVMIETHIREGNLRPHEAADKLTSLLQAAGLTFSASLIFPFTLGQALTGGWLHREN